MSFSGFADLAPKYIEVTTLCSEDREYVLVEGSAPIACSYCGRIGAALSNCDGCGAQVKPRSRREPIIPQARPMVK